MNVYHPKLVTLIMHADEGYLKNPVDYLLSETQGLNQLAEFSFFYNKDSTNSMNFSTLRVSSSFLVNARY